MSNQQPKKIGGEYGDVRANIDVEKLNAYLVKNVQVMCAPIDVKQFKVYYIYCPAMKLLTMDQFGQVYSDKPILYSCLTYSQSNPTYFLTDAK